MFSAFAAFAAFAALHDEKSTDTYFYLDGIDNFLNEEEYEDKESFCEDDFYYDELADYYDSYYDDYNDY
jgi:hypothetical protein